LGGAFIDLECSFIVRGKYLVLLESVDLLRENTAEISKLNAYVCSSLGNTFFFEIFFLCTVVILFSLELLLLLDGNRKGFSEKGRDGSGSVYDRQWKALAHEQRQSSRGRTSKDMQRSRPCPSRRTGTHESKNARTRQESSALGKLLALFCCKRNGFFCATAW
jgi:hypothetical protein